MELKDYLRIIGRYIFVFLIIIALGGLTAFLFTKRQPVTYTASSTFTINKNSSLKQSQVNYYLYDNYYSAQSAALFSQNVISWFASPALVKEVYDKAGIPVPSESQKNLAKTFKTVRGEQATLDVSITGQNQTELVSLLNASGVVIQEKANELSKDSETNYDIVKFTPAVTENKPNIMLNTLAGLAGGLVIAILAVLLIAYFKDDKK